MSENFTLREWLNEERGRVSKIARALDKHYSWVSQIANGNKKAPLETAVLISELTGKSVSVESIAKAYRKKAK
ncbi:transcriptional regulator [Snodgrassella sp. CFCC 13594]|uniref:transcriptional regulator n=1 Tax=Snodgrassella sp. CFCC 13594 TaxID=1775559 RepID=UPI000830E1D9|nr:transcriptional regulator [Snodgrassella sp. CFCC 13594]